MNYQEVCAYLENVDLTMSRYEREEWDAFVKKTGLTINFPYIHITGTNGKGSTANYLYEIYQAAGYKVALFQKPAFYKVNEMISFDGNEILDADFARIFTLKEEELKSSGLSAFEIETYIAFQYFNECKPDIAIIECGMGGEKDSTNLLTSTPLLSVITSVSLEHTAFLGRTISEIARSKCGIIKEKSMVLAGKLDESALTVVRDFTRKKQSDFFLVDDFHNENYIAPNYHFDYRPYISLEILTPAKYQLKNASLAIEAVKILRTKFPVSEAALRKGLSTKPLMCRMERFHNVILDGAHDVEAVTNLMESLAPFAGDKPIHVLFAAFRDKNIAAELPIIDNGVSDITLTTFSSKRARNEEDYFLYLGDYGYNADYKLALNDLVVKYPDDLILVTGSLAFAGLVRKYVVEVLKL